MQTEKDWILENVKKILNEKQLKVENVSNEIGISKGEFSKILSGQRKDYYKYLPQIAQALGISYLELVNNSKINQTNNHQKGGTALHINEVSDNNSKDKVISKCEETIIILKELNENLKQERDYFKRKYENMKAKVVELEKK